MSFDNDSWNEFRIQKQLEEKQKLDDMRFSTNLGEEDGRSGFLSRRHLALDKFAYDSGHQRTNFPRDPQKPF